MDFSNSGRTTLLEWRTSIEDRFDDAFHGGKCTNRFGEALLSEGHNLFPRLRFGLVSLRAAMSQSGPRGYLSD
jgi:hypothetical protein